MYRVILPLLLLSTVAQADVAGDLIAFLGNRTGKIVAHDQAVGDKLYLFDLSTAALTKVSDDINCKGPQISPDGTRVTYFQNDTIYIRNLASGAKTTVTSGYDPHWWIDSSGDEWIYYTTQGSFSDSTRKLWWPDNKGVKTYRMRLKDSKNEWLWDWKGSGGPSPDGLFIGAGYATMILYDTTATKAWLLSNKTQGCNPSMYPASGKYYLMHLELPHDTFCYRDKNDARLWFVLKPTGTSEWQNPEWSTDPDFASATAKDSNTYYSTWVIKLSEINGSTGKIKSGAQGMLKVLPTTGGKDWAEPHLWVGGTAPTPKLVLSPTSLGFTANEDGSDPAAKSVSVTNTSGGTLSSVSTQITYGSGSGWLTVSSSGSGNTQSLSNSVDISGLAANTYSATVKASASGATNSPQSYTVSLTVKPKSTTTDTPSLVLTPTALIFDVSSLTDQVVSVTNGGKGTLAAVSTTVSFVTGDGWLTVTAGGSGISQTLTNHVQLAGLTPDTYSATVKVEASGAVNSPQSYTVSFTVTDLPDAGLVDGGSVDLGLTIEGGAALPDAGAGQSLTPGALVGGCGVGRMTPWATSTSCPWLPWLLLLPWIVRRIARRV